MPETPPPPASPRPPDGLAMRASLLVLPLAFVLAELWARAEGGPFWLWFSLDPDYFYLLDALNIVTLTTPGHVYHPGTTVQWLAALIIAARNLGAGTDAVVERVLAEPEAALRLISTVFIALNAGAAVIVGWAGLRVFRRPVAAWLLQLAPLMSMLIVKHAYHVKPEALLLSVTLALTVVTVLALAPAALDRRRPAFAIAFGVVAGFGLATKVTAAPVFVLPMFVLWGGADGPKAVAVYCLVVALALVVFAAPALGNADVFLGWMMKVAAGSGAYGAGSGVIDPGRYGDDVIKMFKRPALHGVVLLALAVLVVAWLKRRTAPVPAPEVRALAGIAVAVLAHVLLVAKQPNALYLLPSLALAPLALVLAWRLAGVVAPGPWPGRIDRLAALVLAALVAAQGFGVTRLVAELRADRQTALSRTDADFARCARVHAYASSSPAYALLLGDYVTGSRFAGKLAAARPANDYWFEHWWDQSRMVFRSWSGPENAAAVLGGHSCVVVRASHWHLVEKYLGAAAPGLAFDAVCPLGAETMGVRGIGCAGAK